MKEIRNVRGQNTLEYVLVLVAILTVLIALSQGLFRNAINQMFTDSGDTINDATTAMRAATGFQQQNQAPAPQGP